LGSPLHAAAGEAESTSWAKSPKRCVVHDHWLMKPQTRRAINDRRRN
jgi:hypothetical protein